MWWGLSKLQHPGVKPRCPETQACLHHPTARPAPLASPPPPHTQAADGHALRRHRPRRGAVHPDAAGAVRKGGMEPTLVSTPVYGRGARDVAMCLGVRPTWLSVGNVPQRLVQSDRVCPHRLGPPRRPC